MSGFASQAPQDVLDAVGCSHCGAKKGKACTRPSGHECYPHAPRIRAARKILGGSTDEGQIDALPGQGGAEDRYQPKLDI